MDENRTGFNSVQYKRTPLSRGSGEVGPSHAKAWRFRGSRQVPPKSLFRTLLGVFAHTILVTTSRILINLTLP